MKVSENQEIATTVNLLKDSELQKQKIMPQSSKI